ncbi:NucA/NucB deoxyribonuclease domain-containing protein [Bacillus atrophaeus]|nr:NucA/NucB deoxyribonuclease domain-containing protein [Bacillus atrophaeus]
MTSNKSHTDEKSSGSSSGKNKNTDNTADETISFPSDRYPETAKHIENAISDGHSAVCTIDRDGADENRSQSLKDVPTKEGYDRDEWPMAFCAEGGSGADIEYITPSDNRGAGSWVSHKLSDFPDGTRVLFTIK